MKNVNEQEQEMELTPEQLSERKEQMLSFYTESLPYLEAQLKYESLLTSIDEIRFKRTSIQMQYAMMASEMSQEEKEQTKSDNKRVLKKK